MTIGKIDALQFRAELREFLYAEVRDLRTVGQTQVVQSRNITQRKQTLMAHGSRFIAVITRYVCNILRITNNSTQTNRVSAVAARQVNGNKSLHLTKQLYARFCDSLAEAQTDVGECMTPSNSTNTAQHSYDT
jgi:hypothetical protein